MTRFITFFVTALLLASASLSHAIESLAFDVLETNKGIEVRRYAPHMLATVRVAADFKEAGSEAFRPLFDFISGTMPARKNRDDGACFTAAGR